MSWTCNRMRATSDRHPCQSKMSWTCNRMRATSDDHPCHDQGSLFQALRSYQESGTGYDQWLSMWLRLWLHHSIRKLKSFRRAEKYPDSRENRLHDKTFRIQASHVKFRIQNLRRHDQTGTFLFQICLLVRNPFLLKRSGLIRNNFL